MKIKMKNKDKQKMETIKLTANSVRITQNDELGIFDLLYTLVKDDAFEELGYELFKADQLMDSDECGNDPDEIEDWFFDHSKVTDEGLKAKEFYNQYIGCNDIRVWCRETREVTVSGIKFVVSASASKDEMYNNREAQKAVELKVW